jgi:glycosyltransferase involved in cell wall biosynthesis
MQIYPSELCGSSSKASANTLRKRVSQDKTKNCSESTQVIIAALNEQEGIGPTIAELKTHLCDPNLLVVDGRSTDRTVQVAKEMGAQIVLQDGFGKGDAVAKAIEYLEPEAKYIVITDADYTYPASYIPEMIKILNEHPEVGMVCGNRFTESIDKKALRDVFYFGNRLIAFAHNLLNGVKLIDPLTGLRVVRLELLRNWTVQSKGFDIEVELNHHVEQEGFGILEIPIGYRERLGRKKLKVRNGGEIFKRMFLELIHETVHPLP